MKLLRDTALLFGRNLGSTLRNPVWLFIGLFQPICYLLLFAPLLDKVANAPGFPPGGALTVFVPGLVILQGFGSSTFVGFGLIAELRSGMIERLRVTPVSRLALPLGWALRDIVVLLVQSALLVGMAWLFGLRPDGWGVAVTFGLVFLIGLMCASFSYALALALKSEDALAPTLNFLFLPVLLLSGVMLPLTLAPDWIRALAAFNPFSYAVDAARALFVGDFAAAAIVQGFLILGALALLALFWAVRSFRQATA